MTTVVVEFDGANFVPQQPVNLPVGTRATVAISASPVSPEPSPADDPQWKTIVAQIRAALPDPPTVEEAMCQIRMRP